MSFKRSITVSVLLLPLLLACGSKRPGCIAGTTCVPGANQPAAPGTFSLAPASGSDAGNAPALSSSSFTLEDSTVGSDSATRSASTLPNSFTGGSHAL